MTWCHWHHFNSLADSYCYLCTTYILCASSIHCHRSTYWMLFTNNYMPQSLLFNDKIYQIRSMQLGRQTILALNFEYWVCVCSLLIVIIKFCLKTVKSMWKSYKIQQIDIFWHLLKWLTTSAQPIHFDKIQTYEIDLSSIGEVLYCYFESQFDTIMSWIHLRSSSILCPISIVILKQPDHI